MTDPSVLLNMLTDPSLILTHIHSCCERALYMGTDMESDAVDPLATVNVVIAAFMAAQARIYLLKYL